MAQRLWEPSAERRAQAELTRFAQWAEARFGRSLRRFEALHAWSVDFPGEFWGGIWEFYRIREHTPHRAVVEDFHRFPGARWFVGARLNYAENALRRRDREPALVFHSEQGDVRTYTFWEAAQTTEALAASLTEEGIGEGDVVAGYLPNIPEGVLALLAASAVGAVWCVCGTDLGVPATADRLGQLDPKVLFTVDRYVYRGKVYDNLERVAELTKALPSLRRIVVVPYAEADLPRSLPEKAVPWSEFLGRTPRAPFAFRPVEAHHPHIVLFTSGVTGRPKCVIHSVAGTLSAHLKTLGLQLDTRAGDRVLFLSSPTWMVWNVQPSSLLLGATVVLYDGAPLHPDAEVIWRLVDREGVNLVGCGATFLLACMEAGVSPRRTCRLETLRSMFQSGSALPAEGFQYVYEHIKQDLFFNSGLGGTDVQMGILEGTPWQPVYAGQIAGPALGVQANVYDEEGRPVVGKPGELVVERPFPSVPLGLWGDEDGEQFRTTYFGKYPGVWRHGDYVQRDPETGGFIPLGRSDFVLKPSGVRIGPAEIYSVLARVPEIRDCLVVGQKWKGDERIVLFVAPREGVQLTEELAERIRTRLRQEASPRHVPARILEVPDIPYTLNLKRAEGAVWRIVNGGEVSPQLRGALANPEVLAVYEWLAREELSR